LPGFFTTTFTDLVWSHPQKESTMIFQDPIAHLLSTLPDAEVSKENDGQRLRQIQDGRLEGVTT